MKLTLELPASVRRDLLAYADLLGRSTGQAVSYPGKLIAPMSERLTATDRAFAKARRSAVRSRSRPAEGAG